MQNNGKIRKNFRFSSDFPIGVEMIHNSREICIITNFITFTVTYQFTGLNVSVYILMIYK